MHKIITTTDNKFIGKLIDITATPIMLSHDESFTPDEIINTYDKVWRLSNSNYVILAKEV